MADLWDSEEWQEMPVVRSQDAASSEEEGERGPSSKSYQKDREKKRARVKSTGLQSTPTYLPPTAAPTANATGAKIEVEWEDAKGQSLGTKGKWEWREKREGDVEEGEYTRLDLDEDKETEEVWERTGYLFDDEMHMTPLAQLRATKNLLTDAQRIAYVGLCRLVTREMSGPLRQALQAGMKELAPAEESMNNWGTKIMGRLYQHMDIVSDEQRMIENLALHGLTSQDLVPSLITTHTVPNPEYDPQFAKEVEREKEDEQRRKAEEVEEDVVEKSLKELNVNDSPSTSKLDDDDDWDHEMGDIGVTPETPKANGKSMLTEQPIIAVSSSDIDNHFDRSPQTPYLTPPTTPSTSQLSSLQPPPTTEVKSPTSPSNLIAPLPHTLPGVSTTLTAADSHVTLDIRWTVLCDLFLLLIADSIYDARSRVLLGKLADKLGLSWLDVVRFERRLTEALEIQEATKKEGLSDVLEDRKVKGKKKRIVMMGLATLGGGLVIGLSAGFFAPVIGAGLGATLGMVGIGGTSSFLVGTTSAALITTTGVVTGGHIGMKGMSNRMKHVTKFELKPIHNNKRLNVIITLPGFMSGPEDDVRLPFSVLDSVNGDIYSVLWEPEMMGDTGNILKILTAEVLSTVGQQMLTATAMAALMSAVQWPIMLTKLGYLIDNPWSNALDRAKAAGLILADLIHNRQFGIRPVTLIGFSLGARLIFYALAELARRKSFGLVQEVYLMGATVTASKKTWNEVRSVVSGRFLNAYAKNDWVLGYLFRATTGGLQTVAGLLPVEDVPDLENVDITDIVVGHMSYRQLMPTILNRVGFKVTADHFDEPEELEQEMPFREIISREEEERRQADKKRSRFSKIFSRSSRSSTDVTKKSSLSSPNPLKASSDIKRDSNPSFDDDDDLPPRMSLDDLPPRESFASPTSISEGQSEPPIEHPSNVRGSSQSDVTPALKPVPIGFDIDKVRAEIAKSSGRTQTPPVSPASHLMSRPVTERSASVPPIVSSPLASPTTPTNLSTTLSAEEAKKQLREQWNSSATPSSATSLRPLHSPRSQTSQTSLRDAWGESSVNLSLGKHEPDPTSIVFGGASGLIEASSISFGSSDGAVSWDHSLSSRPTKSSYFSKPSHDDNSGITFGSSDGDIYHPEQARGWDDKAPDPASLPSWLIKNPVNSFTSVESSNVWDAPNEAWGGTSSKKTRNGW